MTEKPTKDRVLQLIKEKKYTHVSSDILAKDLLPKKCGRYGGDDAKKLARYIGRNILSALKEDSILFLVNEKSPSIKYGVNYDALEKLIS
ncbi:MAG: hypothetical protein KKB25_02960 [Nanoarchaeota archaeon]|nr:hypothetical protein [Nanoarchaeota archaeon]